MMSFNKTTAEISEIASAIKQSVIDKNLTKTKEILAEIKKNGLNFEWSKDENIINAFHELVKIGEVATLELFLQCLIPSSSDFLIPVLNDVIKKGITAIADCLIAHIGTTTTPSNGNTLLHESLPPIAKQSQTMFGQQPSPIGVPSTPQNSPTLTRR